MKQIILSKSIKNILILFLTIIVLFLSSCKDTTYKEPQIKVSYNWTASLIYYYDNLPVPAVAGKESARNYYGPIPAGAYNYRFKLSFENAERSGQIFLSKPAIGYVRKYTIGIYNYSVEITYYDEKL